MKKMKDIAWTWCYNVSACAVILLLGSCHISYGKVLKEYGEIPIGEQMTPPIVAVPQGAIRGVNMVSYRNKPFFAFKGIPYAKPPVGNLRFKDPVPPVIWSGTMDASRNPEPCVQINPQLHTATGNEDCLYLNIYTPRLRSGNDIKQLPVMVYIFGGKFQAGNINPTLCDPRFILDRDVVLVLPSYRLGVLGFLTTGDEVLPGNYGLKDVVQALKWIQDNVQYFGGDANQVTLFGSSSGSIMVHMLALSSLTGGLFHRYITQSGTALTTDAMVPTSVSSNRATRLGQYLACPTNSSSILVNCLKSLSAYQLVGKTSMFHEWGVFPEVIWNPTVEPDIDGAILTDIPANLLAAGKTLDLPWIALVNRDEGLLYSLLPYYRNPDMFQYLLDDIDSALPVILQYKYKVENVKAFTTALKSYYLNDLTVNRGLIITNITQLIGDAMFIYPTYRSLKERLVVAKNFQYFCSFEYRGKFSSSYDGAPPVYLGVAHADELLYLLPGKKSNYGSPDWEYDDADWKM
ncbi:juvenile hormone esterase-like, partial [Neodiprion virginianus]|uniref:juvenile hormone esterase-like n=1 Tax=Neodiprion virginianus TaxID=2961670 RepID=UPI001EE6EDFC